jgi:DNA-binding PadR family transcriptional regulator
MKSFRNLSEHSFGTSILADDVLEFHAARLLLLFDICGTKGTIDGLTKMAKLDFFVRYPQFFNALCKKLGMEFKSPKDEVESSMVRFHYGPWDHRYYQVLAYLRARNLLEYEKEGKKIVISLTEQGRSQAAELESSPPFQSLVAQMSTVGKVLGKKSGTQLKNLVYETFDEEVALLDLGEVIK